MYGKTSFTSQSKQGRQKGASAGRTMANFSSVTRFRDVASLGTLGALKDLKFHRISLLQGTVSVANDGPVYFEKLRGLAQYARDLFIVHSGPMISLIR